MLTKLSFVTTSSPARQRSADGHTGFNILLRRRKHRTSAKSSPAAKCPKPSVPQLRSSIDQTGRRRTRQEAVQAEVNNELLHAQRRRQNEVPQRLHAWAHTVRSHQTFVCLRAETTM